jgi:hypothetical protein
MWPVLFGKRQVNVDLVADRYTDLMLHGLKPTREHERHNHESRLARLEALVVAPAPPIRGRVKRA